MQSGRGGLLHCFEMFIADVDCEKMVLVIIISCGNSGTSEAVTDTPPRFLMDSKWTPDTVPGVYLDS